MRITWIVNAAVLAGLLLFAGCADVHPPAGKKKGPPPQVNFALPRSPMGESPSDTKPPPLDLPLGGSPSTEPGKGETKPPPADLPPGETPPAAPTKGEPTPGEKPMPPTKPTTEPTKGEAKPTTEKPSAPTKPNPEAGKTDKKPGG